MTETTRATEPIPASRDEFLSRAMRSVGVCAAWAGMPEATVRRLAAEGTVPAVRVGRVWRVSTAGFVRVVDGLTAQP